jgi:hypothetical protein
MTTSSTPTVRENQLQGGTSSVKSHDVTFQLRVLALKGQPVTDESSFYKVLSVADEDLFARLPREVSGWRYLDHYQVECERLEICQPEFGRDDAAEGKPMLYDITLHSSRELALKRSDATPEHPLSVEQLVAEVPALLQDIYAAAGVTVVLHKVSFYKTLQHHVQGEYLLV